MLLNLFKNYVHNITDILILGININNMVFRKLHQHIEIIKVRTRHIRMINKKM